MLTVHRHDLAQHLDLYLDQAVCQSIVIERPQHGAIVMLSLAEFERLQALDDAFLAASLRQANHEGYLDHEQEVRQRLAAAMNQRRSGHDGQPNGSH